MQWLPTPHIAWVLKTRALFFPKVCNLLDMVLLMGMLVILDMGFVAARDTNENATMLIAAWSQRKERIGETILSFAWVPQMPMHHHMLCCAYGIIIFCLYQVAIYKGGLAHFQTHPYLRFAIYRIVVTGDACFG